MTAKEWLTSFASELGIEPPTGEEIHDLLAIAGEAAHASERIAAPITCWLIARAGVSPATALELLQKWKACGCQSTGGADKRAHGASCDKA